MELVQPVSTTACHSGAQVGMAESCKQLRTKESPASTGLQGDALSSGSGSIKLPTEGRSSNGVSTAFTKIWLAISAGYKRAERSKTSSVKRVTLIFLSGIRLDSISDS